jgi:hypothetical protein
VYPQLIQFKRLEERAFIFLNGRQMMFGLVGLFIGIGVANRIGIPKGISWTMGSVFAVLGVVLGARYRGIYGVQYIQILLRYLRSAHFVSEAELFQERVAEGQSYVIGSIDGSARVLHRTTGAQAGEKGFERGEPVVYSIAPIDLSQYSPRSIPSLMQQWASFWVGLRCPARLIVHSNPFDASSVIEQVRESSLMSRERWRSHALQSYARFLTTLMNNAAMYQANHSLVLWPTTETEANATASSMASFIGVTPSKGQLSPVIKGDYEVCFNHLSPLSPHEPYIVMMVSHDFSGDWSWIDPVVSMLLSSFPVSIAIDIDRTLPTNAALNELVKFENVVRDVLANTRTGRNPKAEAALRDVQTAMTKANYGQSLHFATIAVAVKGATLDEARKNADTIQQVTAARVSLVVVPGGQEQLLGFFTTAPRGDVDLPELSHNITSDGMPYATAPLGFRRRNTTDGILFGIGSSGGQDTYPIWWNGFGSDPEKPAAYHGLILGMSGYGKTVAVNALLYREALRGTQVILLEPQGHSRRLVELIGNEGATYNPLSMAEMVVNPLDPISGNLNEQIAFMQKLIAMMLKQIDPNRMMTMQESGLLDQALRRVYSGISDPLALRSQHVPKFEQLVGHLKHVGGAAASLADDLALNYVQGSMGAVFNGATNLDVALEASAVAYDFKDIPESNRTLIYTLVLGRIQRKVRMEGRVRRRVVAIDEFGWLAQEPMLAETVAMWFKTFRTFGCGVWVAEQDLIRLTGNASLGDLSGYSIVGNSTWQMFFHHESAAAQVVTQTYPNLEPYQNLMESFPRPQDRGYSQAVLRIPDGAYHTYFPLADAEQSLIGS